MRKKNEVNILLLGRTRESRSDVIHYLTGRRPRMADAGFQASSGFKTHVYEKIDGLNLRVFESMGLATEDFQAMRRGVIGFVQKCCGGGETPGRIHAVFYCVDARSEPVRDKELALLKYLKREALQEVSIFLTHCLETWEEREAGERLVRRITDSVSADGIPVYRINPLDGRAFEGIDSRRAERREILDGLFRQLLSDAARNAAHACTEEICAGVQELNENLLSAADYLSDRLKPLKLFQMASKKELDQLENVIDQDAGKYKEKHTLIQEEVKRRCQRILEPLTELCGDYSGTAEADVRIDDPSGPILTEYLDLLDMDADDVFENTEFGRLSNRMDELFTSDDSETALHEIVEGFSIIVRAVFSLPRLSKEVFRNIIQKSKQCMPSPEEMERRVYRTLMDGLPQAGW